MAISITVKQALKARDCGFKAFRKGKRFYAAFVWKDGSHIPQPAIWRSATDALAAKYREFQDFNGVK